MAEDIIGMDDMMAIYEVTDRYGVDRESISVPLERDGPGRVERLAGGQLEITAPADVPTRDWLATLDAALSGLGLETVDDEEPWE